MSKLLIVDDEIGIRELLSEILSDEGHAVAAAENAAQAKQLIRTEPFDLILLDIWMPDTDGVTLLKDLSSQRLLRCPVIMMSGHATIDTAVEATRFGACDFLEKPISMQRLLTAVERALNGAPDARAKQSPPASPAERSAQAVVTNATGQELGRISFAQDLRQARDQFETLYLQVLLDEEGFSMSKVAARSGLERTHLYRKIKQLGIVIPPR